MEEAEEGLRGILTVACGGGSRGKMNGSGTIAKEGGRAIGQRWMGIGVMDKINAWWRRQQWQQQRQQRDGIAMSNGSRDTTINQIYQRKANEQKEMSRRTLVTQDDSCSDGIHIEMITGNQGIAWKPHQEIMAIGNCNFQLSNVWELVIVTSV